MHAVLTMNSIYFLAPLTSQEAISNFTAAGDFVSHHLPTHCPPARLMRSLSSPVSQTMALPGGPVVTSAPADAGGWGSHMPGQS